MRGTNPIRGALTGSGASLEVKNIFPTLQGEGPHTGTPAIFIRLGGCNLACSFCDTEFEDFSSMKVEDIVEEVYRLAYQPCGAEFPPPSPPACGGSVEGGSLKRHLVVITGGEPLRQPIENLCEILIEQGFKVQIETNGTLYRPLPEGVEIICSPKNAGQGYYPVRADLLERITAFKFLVSAQDTAYGLVGDVGQHQYGVPVYVQPMDEYDRIKNTANLNLALDIAHRHGYRVSLQTHKLLGID